METIENYKTIIKKSTKEYVHYLDGTLYVCERPKLCADNITLEDFKRYAKDYDDTDLDITDLEIIDIEITIKT